jgi:hypothetical protein
MIDFDAYDRETLARWWNTLNNWNWPDDMPEKPEGFDELACVDKLKDPSNASKPTKHALMGPHMNAIVSLIGMRECLRWHHIHNLGRTNEQFNTWWNQEHPISGFIDRLLA